MYSTFLTEHDMLLHKILKLKHSGQVLLQQPLNQYSKIALMAQLSRTRLRLKQSTLSYWAKAEIEHIHMQHLLPGKSSRVATKYAVGAPLK